MAEVPESLRAALADRYTLERQLGRGGMAVVYLARDLRYDRAVAIKVLNHDLAAAVGRARFLLEIQFAARLNHPHILPLLDSGEAGELLYYVMPCVDGESLKDRLEREKQLPVRDAIAIAREVAAGLHHAHSQGIVHRDVKPGNILLSGGSAVVTDFGIARAVRRSATDDTLTDVNLAIGTPPYMSPEQWSGTRELDARSDVYSLGCVVYEMLAGQPPFTGSTTEAIAARVAFDPVPSIRTVRPRVSAALEGVILKALEKVPADRYETASDFAEALAAAPLEDTGQAPIVSPTPGRRWLVAAAGGIAVAAVGWLFVRPLIGGDRVVPDTTRYVVFPFELQGNIEPFGEDDLLYDAMSRWKGIAVVPPVQVEEALQSLDGAVIGGREARRLAHRMHAGRFVRGRISIAGDSLRVWAGVFELARTDFLLRQATVRLGSRSSGQEAAAVFTLLADSLLFAEVRTRLHPVSWTGTLSAPARQAYGRGHAAIEEWDLGAADSAFAAAVAHDPQYAQAHLWLAQVRAWSVAPPITRRSTAPWRSPAERAAAARARLGLRERIIADALVAAARGESDTACLRWRDLIGIDSLDFVAWYGLGSCLASDDAVVPDGRGPSGWRFRSSYGEAMRAYQRAYQLMPSIHRALRANSYESVRALLKTRSVMQRGGRGVPPDTTRYAAYPEWRGDSLAFIPYPDRPGEVLRIPETRHLAVRNQRLLFHEMALGWVSAYPGSPDAMEALALALEMLGDPASLDTLRRARALVTTPAGRVRTGSAEVWMLVRRSVPDDLAGLRTARALADSLLDRFPPRNAPEPHILAGLAALTGRVARTAAYMRETAVPQDPLMAGAIARTAPALLVFASLGGPADSLSYLEGELTDALEQMTPDEKLRTKATWLARAASLAFPEYRFATMKDLADVGDYLVDAQLAFDRGDTVSVRRMFARRAARRRSASPADISLDGLYPEAVLLAAMRDTVGAIAWLDPTLTAVAEIAPQSFDDPTRPASLVRAMVLRARLAMAVHDTAAVEKWRRAVDVLWSGADPFVRNSAGITQ